jgi:transposase
LIAFDLDLTSRRNFTPNCFNASRGSSLVLSCKKEITELSGILYARDHDVNSIKTKCQEYHSGDLGFEAKQYNKASENCESYEARYDHRLHAVLMVAQGQSCNKVSELLGDSPRAVAYWVNRFEAEGLSGLADADRPGRPSKLDEQQLRIVEDALRSHPSQYGFEGNLWDGKMLSHFIAQQFDVELGVRQCQRLFRRLGFRLRKPRPLIAKADPEKQQDFKKNR